MKKFLGVALAGLIALVAVTFAVTANRPAEATGGPDFKVTICHFDRNDSGPNAGPHTIEVAPSAVFSHLFNHTKNKGYIGDDFLGPCPEPTATPTATATNTPEPTATDTPTETPTATPTDTATPEPTETNTPEPTNTPTCEELENCVTPTCEERQDCATATFTPTATPTDDCCDERPTRTPTNTPVPPTATPTATPTGEVPVDAPSVTPVVPLFLPDSGDGSSVTTEEAQGFAGIVLGGIIAAIVLFGIFALILAAVLKPNDPRR